MLYIHPPLAFIGYGCVFTALGLLTVWAVNNKRGIANDHIARWFILVLRSAWVFTFLGLVSGMIWAQLAWGAYWSWDPKETATLVLFLGISAQNLIGFLQPRSFRKHLALQLMNCALVIVTVLVGVIIEGLHSFA